jgi:hypothetical protein
MPKIMYWSYKTQLLMAERMGATIPTVRKWLKIVAAQENAGWQFEHKPRSK